MMRALASVGVAAALLAGSALLQAEELKSGKQVGEKTPAFQVVKVGGADDGVKDGQQLCYRWKFGGRPTVMVFARKTDGALAGLVKEIGKFVEANSEKKAAAFVNVIGGDDRDALEEAAKKFVKENEVTNVPIVVPVEFDNGPKDYGINPKADLTVLIYVNTEVKANHAFGEGQFTKEKVKAVAADFSKIVE